MWAPYVPVAERRAHAARTVKQLEAQGRRVDPVSIDERSIARTFWGKAWCTNLERYSDYSNRLPRGRTYVKNGSVIDLQIAPGRVKALVSGSEIYEVCIDFTPLEESRWEAVRSACMGKIDSVVELLQGKLSKGVMALLTAEETGLFPTPSEIHLSCSCPDWARMCKHVSAVLYGTGARLDTRPDLLFRLRGVDEAELISQAAAGATLVGAPAAGEALGEGELEDVFGIEIEAVPPDTAVPPAVESPGPRISRTRATRQGKKAAGNGSPASGKHASGSRGKKPRLPRSSRDPDSDRLPLLERYFGLCEVLTNTDYRAVFGVSGPAASRELRGLVDRKVLVRHGEKRGAYYLAGAGLKAARVSRSRRRCR